MLCQEQNIGENVKEFAVQGLLFLPWAELERFIVFAVRLKIPDLRLEIQSCGFMDQDFLKAIIILESRDMEQR